MADILEIDGSVLEGGGQILRNALSLSAICGRLITVKNIRSGRDNPGLRPQHLAGVKLVASIANAELSGAAIGSTEITFKPTMLKGGLYSADPGTAGSVILMVQVALPCLLFADGPSELRLRGGTNADMAPQIDYTLQVFQPIARRMGIEFQCQLIKRGFYPKGGGEIVVNVKPIQSCLKPIEIMDFGHLSSLRGLSFVAGVLPFKVAHEMADAAQNVLKSNFPKVPIKLERLKDENAFGNGNGIVIIGTSDAGCLIGGSALGKRGVSARDVGVKAAEEILESIHNRCSLDKYMQDQLVIFMALAEGTSHLRIGAPTLHTKTAIHVAELLTKAKFKFSSEETQEDCILECNGIGFKQCL